MRTVLIVLFDRVQSLDVTGPLEVFAGANRWQSGRDPDSPDGPAYRIRTASLGGRAVRTSSGLRLAPDQDLADEARHDVLLVPGGEGARHADPAGCGRTAAAPTCWCRSAPARSCWPRRACWTGAG